MQLRDRIFQRLDEEVFDVLVIGAGINGAVSAAALAARGVKVALVDRGDFASFTSQESSNLVWGGIKYLENYEFRLVWKLCRSRNDLIRSFPSNIKEIRFFAPLSKGLSGFKRTVFAVSAGTWLYWFMGGFFTRPPRWLTLKTIESEEPKVATTAMKGGVEYSDAYLLDNDARFVFNFIKGALNDGAACINYVEAKGSKRSDGAWATEVTDVISAATKTIRSRAIINCAGPFVDPLNQGNDVSTKARHLFSKGIHLVVDRIAKEERVLTFFDENNRMFFVIPMGHRSVIGTTDTPVKDPVTVVTDEDRRFVLDNINRCLDITLTEDDVIAERCGVRPLVVEDASTQQEDGEQWFSLSRKHIIEAERDKQHISVFGGKLTDCVNVGEEICELVEELGIALPHGTARWYGEPDPIVRAEFMEQARRIRLDDIAESPDYEKLSDRLWRRYGTDAFAMLEEIRQDRHMGDPIIEDSEYRRCELAFASRSEMVVKLDDFLRRRAKLAQVSRRSELRDTEGMMEACRILFGEQAQSRFDEYFGAEAVESAS